MNITLQILRKNNFDSTTHILPKSEVLKLLKLLLENLDGGLTVFEKDTLLDQCVSMGVAGSFIEYRMDKCVSIVMNGSLMDKFYSALLAISKGREMPDEDDQEHNRREMDVGLYNKYVIRRTEGDPTGKHENCFCFVLDLEHDPYAYAALDLYANNCMNKYPVLGYELKQKLKEFTIRQQVDGAAHDAIRLLTQQGYTVVRNGEIQT